MNLLVCTYCYKNYWLWKQSQWNRSQREFYHQLEIRHESDP